MLILLTIFKSHQRMLRNDDLFIYYQNARSVCNKLSTLRSGLHQITVTPKIIIFTETWLKPCIMSSELSLHSYALYRCNRISDELQRGGGALIAVHHSITLRQLDFFLQSDSVFLEVKFMDLAKFKYYIITVAYIPPNSSTTNEYNDRLLCRRNLTQKQRSRVHRLR